MDGTGRRQPERAKEASHEILATSFLLPPHPPTAAARILLPLTNHIFCSYVFFIYILTDGLDWTHALLVVLLSPPVLVTFNLALLLC